MESFLHGIGIAAALAGCLLAIASLIVGLPGTLAILAIALLYAWLTGFAAVTWGTIGWLALLAAVGEGLELAAAGLATAGARPSRRVTVAAVVGALAGGIVGTPFLIGLGSLVGALAGAFAGAALAAAFEGGSLSEAGAVGVAAMKGRLLGFAAKAASRGGDDRHAGRRDALIPRAEDDAPHHATAG
jgi:hypothetical protein